MKTLNPIGARPLLASCLALAIPCASAFTDVEPLSMVKFEGMCDASGAVPLSDSLFMVADDEDNILRVYDADKGGHPVNTFDLTTKLKQKLQHLASEKERDAIDLDSELDLEAATNVDGVSYWLSSHARNKKGKEKDERFQLFALSHDATLEKVELIGQPYGGLLDAMIGDPNFKPYRLNEAASRAAEDDFAVNIEGMTARFDGGVYIGFRNPVPKGKALVVALENPAAVVQGQAPSFGTPIELDLEGLGVRGLTSWQDTYIIAAGDIASGEASVLYSWGGGNAAPRRMSMKMPADFNPEAFFTPEHRERFLVLSDDGALDVDGSKKCKKLKDPSKKSFRGMWLKNASDAATPPNSRGESL